MALALCRGRRRDEYGNGIETKGHDSNGNHRFFNTNVKGHVPAQSSGHNVLLLQSLNTPGETCLSNSRGWTLHKDGPNPGATPDRQKDIPTPKLVRGTVLSSAFNLVSRVRNTTSPKRSLPEHSSISLLQIPTPILSQRSSINDPLLGMVELSGSLPSPVVSASHALPCLEFSSDGGISGLWDMPKAEVAALDISFSACNLESEAVPPVETQLKSRDNCTVRRHIPQPNVRTCDAEDTNSSLMAEENVVEDALCSSPCPPYTDLPLSPNLYASSDSLDVSMKMLKTETRSGRIRRGKHGKVTRSINNKSPISGHITSALPTLLEAEREFSDSVCSCDEDDNPHLDVAQGYHGGALKEVSPLARLCATAAQQRPHPSQNDKLLEPNEGLELNKTGSNVEHGGASGRAAAERHTNHSRQAPDAYENRIALLKNVICWSKAREHALKNAVASLEIRLQAANAERKYLLDDFEEACSLIYSLAQRDNTSTQELDDLRKRVGRKAKSASPATEVQDRKSSSLGTLRACEGSSAAKPPASQTGISPGREQTQGTSTNHSRIKTQPRSLEEPTQSRPLSENVADLERRLATTQEDLSRMSSLLLNEIRRQSRQETPSPSANNPKIDAAAEKILAETKRMISKRTTDTAAEQPRISKDDVTKDLLEHQLERCIKQILMNKLEMQDCQRDLKEARAKNDELEAAICLCSPPLNASSPQQNSNVKDAAVRQDPPNQETDSSRLGTGISITVPPGYHPDLLRSPQSVNFLSSKSSPGRASRELRALYMNKALPKLPESASKDIPKVRPLRIRKGHRKTPTV